MGNQEAGQTAGQTSNHAKKPAFQISKAPRVVGTILAPSPVTEDAATSAMAAAAEAAATTPAPLYEDLGALPTGYGSEMLFLIARDPEWLFCYWDLDWQLHPPPPNGRLALKIFDPESREVYSSPLTPDARDWYIPVPGTERRTTPAGTAPLFYGEIGFLHPDGAWERIVRSNETPLLQGEVSSEIHDQFATIPFHLAFQEVLDVVSASMGNMCEGESLMATLSRLQGESRNLIFSLGRAPRWTPEQRNLLAALLGNELNELLGLTTEEIDLLLRKQLNERLGSEGHARMAEMTDLGGGASSASLLSTASSSSLLSSPSSHSLSSAELLSRWPLSSDQSFWSSWLTSWSQGAQGSVSSWLTSWTTAHLGESLSSASLSSSLSSLSLLSSWPSAMGARESAFWSSWLSSWGVGLGGASAFGSRESGSNWSAQPFGVARSGRDFFMHVNAEVIFYGGTHPEAQLWIDGKPVPLKADGSFHFHFKFPDGEYTIPIVAQSPDGVEQRSATLRFARGTGRQGEVHSTPQPSYLDDPMGKK